MGASRVRKRPAPCVGFSGFSLIGLISVKVKAEASQSLTPPLTQSQVV